MSTLKNSAELANVQLNLPSVPEEFLALKYLADNEQELIPSLQEKYSPFPLAAGDVIELPIKDVIWLSQGNDVKETVDMSFCITEKDFHFKPGDTIGIIPSNPPIDVEKILHCLGISKTSKSLFTVLIKTGTKKKNAAVPLFIPEVTNARHVIEKCLEIRAPLKKLFMRALVEHTTDPREKRRLEELCSKQGAKEFAQFITEARVSLLDILECFPSCRPPLTTLLEFLPRLTPRPYSISSSPLFGPEFHIVLSLQKFSSPISFEERQGVCSGWLFDIAKQILKNKSTNMEHYMNLSQQFGNISLKNVEKVKQVQPLKLFLRKSTEFCLPADESLPLIFIGPGTGVAPFIGFLQHRDLMRKNDPNLQFGDIWLFFGCRYKERDYFYKEMIDNFVESGVLSKLFVSFSRDSEGAVKYVQDNIKLHSKQFVDYLLNKNGIVYVCGDATGMAKDVQQTIVSAVQTENGVTEQEAMQQVTDLKTTGRYVQDIWA